MAQLHHTSAEKFHESADAADRRQLYFFNLHADRVPVGAFVVGRVQNQTHVVGNELYAELEMQERAMFGPKKNVATNFTGFPIVRHLAKILRITNPQRKIAIVGFTLVEHGDGTKEIHVDTTNPAVSIWILEDKNSDVHLHEIKESTYIYTTLNELKLGETCNIFGVVADSPTLNETENFQQRLLLKLCDANLAQSRRYVHAIILANSSDETPKIVAAGEIIRIHRVRVKAAKNKTVELCGTIGSKGCHCLSFERESPNTDPKHSTGAKFTFSDDDRAKVKELRQWASIRGNLPILRNLQPLLATSKMKSIDHDAESITKSRSRYWNLRGFVIGVFSIRGEQCALRICDGTKLKINLQWLDADLSIYQAQKYFQPLNEWAVAHGFSVDVFCYDEYALQAWALEPGQWIRIVNVHVFTDPIMRDSLTLHGGGAEYRRRLEILESSSQAQLERRLERLPGFSEAWQASQHPADLILRIPSGKLVHYDPAENNAGSFVSSEEEEEEEEASDPPPSRRITRSMAKRSRVENS